MNGCATRIVLPPNSRREKARRPCAAAENASDRSVVMPIVLLLIADGCDFWLIFSLLYILL